MNSRKSSGGGFKGLIITGITLVMLASALVGIAKVNNLNSPSDMYGFFKSWSDKVAECTGGKVEWNCESPFDGGSGAPGGNSGSDPVPGEAGSGSSSDESLKKVEGITISDVEKVKYDRSDWKHWTGSPCNTREEVLKEQGKNVKTDSECRATSGTWDDPYSQETFTDAGELDIDHVIPLSYANSHGGSKWTAEQKETFANDKTQLLAVDASENRKKSDKGPSEYMPPNKSYHCEYSKLWVDTATKYDLSITEKDKDTLTKALKKCDA